MEQGRSGALAQPVVRHQGRQAVAGSDQVAEEVPVALVFNGISQAVMMATPRDLEAFAAGFALSEGIVAGRASIHDIEVRRHAAGIEVELTIAQQAFAQLKQRRRTLAGRTGCGLCGIDSLAQLDLAPERLAAPLLPPDLALALRRAGNELAAHQPLMQASGGVHAAAWCLPDGQVSIAFEDIGRHNALDKLIGHLALAGASLRGGFVFMSSRASYELVRKCARMQIGMLATISAPSSLAIAMARQAGMKLVSFCRADGFVDYTAADSCSSTGTDLEVGVPAPSALLDSGTSGLVSG